MTQNVNSSDFFKELKKTGFEEVYKEPYQELSSERFYSAVKQTEKNCFYLFFHKTFGVLAAVNTTNNARLIKQCRLYYNWVPKKEADLGKIIGEGEMIGDVWVAAHNVITDVNDILNNLKRNGTLLPKWKYIPTLILLHTQQIKELVNLKPRIGGTPQKRIHTINNKIISALPQGVKKSITPKKLN